MIILGKPRGDSGSAGQGERPRSASLRLRWPQGTLSGIGPLEPGRSRGSQLTLEFNQDSLPSLSLFLALV